MFLSYVSRTAPRVALIVLGAAVCVGGWSRLIAASAPPAAPVNLSATVDGSNVTLSWRESAAGSVYQLEAGSRPGATDLGVTRLGTTVCVRQRARRHLLRARASRECRRNERALQ